MSLRHHALLGGLLGIACAGPAGADVTLQLATHSGGMQGSETIYIAGDSLRIDTAQDGERSSMLFDAKTQTLTMLDDQEKAYLAFTREAAAQLAQALEQQQKAAQAQLDEQLKTVPAEERQALEATLKAEAGLGAPKRRVERTQRKLNINGYACEVVEVWLADEKEQSHCVSPREALGLSETEFHTFEALLVALERMAGDDGGPARELGGVPVRSEESTEGEELVTELKKIERAPIAAERFKIPDGYRKQDPLPLN